MMLQQLRKVRNLVFVSSMAALLIACGSNELPGPSPTSGPAETVTLKPAVSPAVPSPTSSPGPAATAPSTAGTVAGASPTVALKVTGKVLDTQGATTNVHDPAMIKDGDTYYLFSTGPG